MGRSNSTGMISQGKNPILRRRLGWVKDVLPLLVLACITTTFSACGGGGSSIASQDTGPLTGNWQFTMTPPSDGSYIGGLQGGFLLEARGAVTGAVVYSVSLPPAQAGAQATLCNGGSAPVTGTFSGQAAVLTAVAGTQTFFLTGTPSADGFTMMGTYSSTDGQGCGTAQSGLAWSAVFVPPLTGAVQGVFHSTGSGAVSSLQDQDFPVTGSLSQGPNIGASNATITGTLNFQGYPCMATASVNGQISGTSLILQVVTPDGLNVGQIGAPAGSSMPSPVTVANSAPGAQVVTGKNGYGISTKTCKGANTPGDVGNICLAMGNSTACTQPIALTPASLSFPAQLVGSPPTTQSVTLTNIDPSGSTLNGLQLGFRVVPTTDTSNPSDFDLQPSFTEQDNCAASLSSPFSLASQQSCVITVSFSPQQSCPWLPLATVGGLAPSACPPFLGTSVPVPPAQTAIVAVTSPTSADADKIFAVPISGIGISALQPSTPELDFGAEALSETSPPQTVFFTNQGNSGVQILTALATPPCGSPGQPISLPRPTTVGSVPGLQVVTSSIGFVGSTVDYVCDIDPVTTKPNFQLSSNTCAGALLEPQESCSVAVTFAPQQGAGLASGLDYFLQLNTLECTSTTPAGCEIDSGRFPVELKANTPSPLRMSPGAGLDFGPQSVGSPSAPLQITLFNDPNDPNSGTINFTGNVVSGDYAETDNCGTSLAPGGSCVLNTTFAPTVKGFDKGTLTITYNGGQTQIVFLRGIGQ